MDLRQLFATNLRRIRHDRGVSQEGLANEAGVDVVNRLADWVVDEALSQQ